MNEIEKELKKCLTGKFYIDGEQFKRAYEILTGEECAQINMTSNGETLLSYLYLASKSPEMCSSLKLDGEENAEQGDKLLEMFEKFHSAGIRNIKSEIIDKRSSEGRQPLIMKLLSSTYLINNNLPIFRLKLIEKFCEACDYYSMDERDVLYFFASNNGNLELLRLLKNKGFNLALPFKTEINETEQKMTLLSRSISEYLYYIQHKEITEFETVERLKDKIIFLLENGGYSPENDKESILKAVESYLMFRRGKDVILQKIKEIVDLLLAQGAKIDLTIIKNGEPLPLTHYITCKLAEEEYDSHLEKLVYSRLKELGADINAKDELGRTAFVYCLEKRMFYNAFRLLLAGADTTQRTERTDPLFYIGAIVKHLGAHAEKVAEAIYKQIILPRFNLGEDVLKRDILGNNFLDNIKKISVESNAILSPYFDTITEILSKRVEELRCKRTYMSLYEYDNSDYFDICQLVEWMVSAGMSRSQSMSKADFLRRTKGGDNILIYLIKFYRPRRNSDARVPQVFPTDINNFPFLYLLCNDFDREKQSAAYCLLTKLTQFCYGEYKLRHEGLEKLIIDAAIVLVRNTDYEHLSAASLATGKNCRDLAAELISILPRCDVYDVTDNFQEKIFQIDEILREKGVGFSLYRRTEAGPEDDPNPDLADLMR